jgi:bifunctional UDP-N-acetylglucosamine pyrophosphorylase/glucosamine-1-phosphate N-acetyltransferase
MASGVTIEDPATTFIDRDVEVGADTVIHPGVCLEGATRVGARCELHSGVRIVGSRIGDRVVVHNHSVITQSAVDSGASVGPFAHLRNESTVGARAKVGNFVEMKKTSLGEIFAPGWISIPVRKRPTWLTNRARVQHCCCQSQCASRWIRIA